MRFSITIELNRSNNQQTQPERLTRESWARVREIVKNRDGETCQYCGRPAPDGEPDHVLPLAKGGTDALTNLVWSCPECNRSKGSKSLREWVQGVGPTKPPPLKDVTPPIAHDVWQCTQEESSRDIEAVHEGGTVYV